MPIVRLLFYVVTFSFYQQIMSRPLLVAFDFDHTICEDNTDIIARKLLPMDKLPNSVKWMYESEGWTAYMARIFELLHANNIDINCIRSAINNIHPVSGMETLLTELYSQNCEIIIISDSNSIFIESWLKHHELDHTVTQIFTNPATVDDNGMLKIEMYHLQDWCKLSEKNMCKGHILENYIKMRSKDGMTFDKIVYVGDGRNDLCPSLKLSKQDLVFPRIDYVLIKIINDPANENSKGIICDVIPWKSGHDILKEIKENVFSK